MSLYTTKAAANARLIPVVDRLAAAGVTPDQVTLAAIPVAMLGGACLLAERPKPDEHRAAPAGREPLEAGDRAGRGVEPIVGSTAVWCSSLSRVAPL